MTTTFLKGLENDGRNSKKINMSINQTNLKISALICFLTFVCQAFAQDLEFEFFNFYYNEKFYDSSKNQELYSSLNKDFETIFKFTDDGILYSCQYTENGETISTNLIDSNYEDIVVFESDGELTIAFIHFDTYIGVSPFGEISFFDPLLEYDLCLYKDLEGYSNLDFLDVPNHNYIEFMMLAKTFYEKGMLSEKEYQSLINTLLFD